MKIGWVTFLMNVNNPNKTWQPTLKYTMHIVWFHKSDIYSEIKLSFLYDMKHFIWRHKFFG